MKSFEEIVAERFAIPVDQVSDATSPADIPDWDSMGYLLFIAALEKNFNVSFSMDEVLATKTLGDVRKMLTQRGIAV